MEKNIIPTLDWKNGSRSFNDNSFVKDLIFACSTYGFFFLKNHGISKEIIERAENSFKNFFNLTNEEKMQYVYPENGYQNGFTPFGIETGEYAPKNKKGERIADRKEFCHANPLDLPIVKELHDFNNNVIDLWWQFQYLGEKLLQSFALSFGNTPVDFFKDKELGYSVLRGIHYPASKQTVFDGIVEGGNLIGMCATPHTDINLLTFLLAKEKGLQILYNRKWIPVTISDPDLLIVNCGDMMEHVTNGFYKSVIHQVVCEENKERFSIPFFLHPDEERDISPLPVFIFGDPNPKYCYKTAGEFKQHRFRQLGLIV